MIKEFKLTSENLTQLVGRITDLLCEGLILKVTVSEWRKSRKDRQRALANIWYGQIDNHLGEPPGHAEALCKYNWGLRIRCRDNLELENIVRSVLDGRAYDDKLEIIQRYSEWFPVMRKNGGLNAEGQAEYLNAIQTCFAAEGLVLSTPKDDDLLRCKEANK